MKKSLSVMLMISILGMYSHAQQSQDSVLVSEVIVEMFDAMRLGDSTALHAIFHPEGKMFTVAKNRNGEEAIIPGSFEQFAQAVGTPHEEVWDERISNLDIKIDGRLAQAWMNYEFYLGEQYLHKGVNAFWLVKENDSWKIFQIIDTRRKE